MLKAVGNVFGEVIATIARLGNLLVSGNTISSTNTNGDINLDPNGTGRIIQAGVMATGSGTVLTSEGKTGTATDAVAFTTFTTVVSDNSTTRVDVDLVAIEMTGYIATISRKYVFTLRQRSGTLTATAVNSVAGFEITESSGNYVITPTVAVTIVDATTARFDVTLTKGGAIGWVNCLYGARACVNSVKAVSIS
jgi:hypothetical protein